VKKAADVISTKSVEIKSNKNPKKSGRKPKHGVSKKEIAEALGVSTSAVVQAEQHVETAEEFPFMQGDDWQFVSRDAPHLRRVLPRTVEYEPCACPPTHRSIHRS
jgi:hypothetical protein